MAKQVQQRQTNTLTIRHFDKGDIKQEMSGNYICNSKEKNTISDGYKDILIETTDLACTITINRPKMLNAFTGDTIIELEDAVQRTYDDNEIGAVVLTGAGHRSSSASGDVNWEASGGLEDTEWRLGRYIVDCPKPIVARIPGYAISGGNHLAYLCDFMIAAEHARFG